MDRGIPASETMRRVSLDPALEASEMVRALAIRRWYGFDRILLDAYPLATFDPTGRAGVPATLSEYDHSPKPALAALDFLNEMLNDASPLDWIDGAKGARAVAFERGDDRGVALLWRPFGSTPIMHRLVGIGRLVSTDSGSEGGAVEVRNCFGQLEPCTIDGRDLIVPVSAMVLYVTAEGPPWQELLRALPFAMGEPDLPKNN